MTALGAWTLAAGCIYYADGEPCTVQGIVYASGDTFPSPYDCNTCSCEDGAVYCTTMGCVDTCTYDGEEYFPGETFPASDGCNTCSCGAYGEVFCTDMACPVPCTYAGVAYLAGDTFPALDGCNTCSCGSDGSVGCTKINCPCEPAAEWYRDYVLTDPAQCALADFLCPTNTTHFANDCGCGCEQDPSCPEWFDCMPPKPCDLQEIAHECPYSGVAL
jgi:hypothetical protein